MYIFISNISKFLLYSVQIVSEVMTAPQTFKSANFLLCNFSTQLLDFPDIVQFSNVLDCSRSEAMKEAVLLIRALIEFCSQAIVT